MPGAYTHITLVNEAAEPVALQAVADLPDKVMEVCGKWLKFCELGVVSPDYPYLHFISKDSKKWADLMHYKHTDRVIKSAIEQLQKLSGEPLEKGLAWLLGYTTHVVMDATMHPVINKRVGPYEQFAVEHRICEMHQDVYIFRRLNLDDKLAEHIDTGISACTTWFGGLDKDIRKIWTKALADAYPEEMAINKPKPSKWHRWFRHTVDKLAESRGLLVAISRHVAPGTMYPSHDKLDFSYIKDLPAPLGGTIHFDDLFEIAKRNVHRIWADVAAGALGINDNYKTAVEHWDLDSGKNAAGKLAFWST